jgi:hypothetical protein
MRVAQRSDRIEPLLVGHDKQDVRPADCHSEPSEESLMFSTDAAERQNRDVSLRST